MAKKSVLLVLSNVTPGHSEDEYNDWYTNQHLADVLAIPGFSQAQRFKIVGEPVVCESKLFRYAANYELDTDTPQTSIDAMMAVVGTDRMPMSPAIDPGFYVVLYEPITDLVKA